MITVRVGRVQFDPEALADARLAPVGGHHQPAGCGVVGAVEGVGDRRGRSRSDPGRAGASPDGGAPLGGVRQQCLLELRVADADAAAARQPECPEVDRARFGLVGRERLVVADVTGDQVGVRDRVDDATDAERLGFEDPPRCQPFAPHPVAERGLPFEHQHVEPGTGQHCRGG